MPDDVFLGTIPNNSAVILDQQEAVLSGEVICHSALKSNCIGQWNNATEPLASHCPDSPGVFSSVALNLSTITEEGIYSCVVQDEEMKNQELFIGFYHSG